ncbi:probable ubiquitin-conjugating enzyme E2 23 isoform X2 [Chenopodium quinoa]|uniref:probable ubiquitin-conjugating enzyme E2 23 isoform X2 n=1 Tax=Chenopodium quinoa TaxID=63459 RepID=UPI000B798655|nr:probable ubiquitin-conjugating enzyme E2 23 isoform X2 [Chenopodium quinoa]
MTTDQHDASIAIEGMTSVSGDSLSSEGVSAEVSSNRDAKNDSNLVIDKIPNEKHIYRQDVVRCRDGSMIGVVTEVAGDSDSDSDSDITDDSDQSDEDDKGEEEGEEEGDGVRREVKEEEGDGVCEEVKEEDNVENDGDDGDGNESSDDNRSSGHDKREQLTGDQVRVLWMDDSENTNHRNELTVVDRGFLHGDYVASALDPTGQVGLVVDVNITVDFLSHDGTVFNDVSSRDLMRVRDIVVSDYVVSGPWLGRVDDVLDNVTVLFNDGSICKVTGAEPLRLRPIAKNLLEDGHCPYHPGQRVRASSSSVFKNARWLSGSWKANRLEGTVIKVTVGSVYVHWIASAGYGPDSSTSPAEEQNPKNLKVLSCFTHANWQLGDWCFLPALTSSSSIPLDKNLSKLRLHESESGHPESDADEVIPEDLNVHIESMDHDEAGLSENIDENTQNNLSPKSSSRDTAHESWQIHRKKLRKVVVKRDKKVRKKEETYERALLIVNTKTRVDVAWQDGTVQRGLDSTLLIPIESPGDHDFIAEQYVVEKAADDGEETSEIRRVGVVKSVDAKEKTACVKWLKQVTRPEEPREFENEEVVSVYVLEGHPDYDYCYGDVVVRLSPAFMATEAECPDPRESATLANAKEGDASDEAACNELSNLSWVGNITGLKNGDIEVTWADGMISTVGPQAVYVVGRDDDESIGAGSEISDDAASWETVEDDEKDALDNSEKEPTPEGNPDAGHDIVVAEQSSGNGPLTFPLAAIEYVTRFASNMFSRGRSDGDSSGPDDSVETSVQPEETKCMSGERASSNVSNTQDPCVIDSGSGQTSSNKGEESAEVESAKLTNMDEALGNLTPNEPYANEPYAVLCTDGSACSFKRFDTAKDPLDHFFLGTNIQGNSGRKWLKMVQRDWNILQNNLPEGIYVRVYEDRMDLLRAVIVGAYGTPYQDGLFFFDFHLPPEYPDVPPSAHYHSGGWRLNPNLYEEGKVCLSLLNTWTGRGNEVWDPQSSSILQVLVSLQGLVLNSKPYFNEAGYDKQVGTAEGEKNSLSYNENTFLLNCKTIMYLIRKPPKDFEDLVKEHFGQRGYYILKACDAYMKGYLIGSLAKDATLTEKSEANATSVGFKLMLAKIVPKLISTFNNIGADCHEFEHLLQS